jgi:hypothetical protein
LYDRTILSIYSQAATATNVCPLYAGAYLAWRHFTWQTSRETSSHFRQDGIGQCSSNFFRGGNPTYEDENIYT